MVKTNTTPTLKKELQTRGLSMYQVVKKLKADQGWRESDWYAKIQGKKSISWIELNTFIQCANKLIDQKKFSPIYPSDIGYVIKRIQLV